MLNPTDLLLVRSEGVTVPARMVQHGMDPMWLMEVEDLGQADRLPSQEQYDTA